MNIGNPCLAQFFGASTLVGMDPETLSRLPDKRDVAARAALAAMPPAPLERVLEQATASRKFISEWRAKGLPDLPDTLRPLPIK